MLLMKMPGGKGGPDIPLGTLISGPTYEKLPSVQLPIYKPTWYPSISFTYMPLRCAAEHCELDCDVCVVSGDVWLVLVVL